MKKGDRIKYRSFGSERHFTGTILSKVGTVLTVRPDHKKSLHTVDTNHAVVEKI